MPPARPVLVMLMALRGGRLVEPLGIVEIGLDDVPIFLGEAHDPHDHEEGHHGGDKVGVSDFPGPAVVSVAVDLFSS